MNDKLNNKLQKIEDMLNNQEELDKYIKDIQDTEISYSNKLEEKILSRVNKNKRISNFNILKMVACMILALILCQTDFIKGSDYTKDKYINHEIVQKSSYLDEKVSEISNFFMKPVIMKEEK